MPGDPDTTPLRRLTREPATGPLPRAEPRTTPTRGTAGRKPPHSTEGAAALFRIHLFPIGHLPQPRTEPLRQLPAPDSAELQAAGTRYRTADHPSAHLVDTRARTPRRPARGQASRPERGALADATAQAWRRRYVVREAGDHPTEYAWPPAEHDPEGRSGEPVAVVLEAGTSLDRFGTEHGRIFGEPASTFAARSLPPPWYAAEYHRYRVCAPLPVWQTTSAPWFDSPGGAPRYRATYSAAELVALGYLDPEEGQGR